MEGKEYKSLDKEVFLESCTEFFKQEFINGDWTHWIAVNEGEIISVISIQRVNKIPKPNRIDNKFGYVTNVYTRPLYRGKGIGSKLMDKVKEWAKEEGLECLIVWPSGGAIKFYQRKGFNTENDIIELQVIEDEE